MDNPLFDYSAIVSRPRLRLPNRERTAVWFGINIEYFVFGRPGLSLWDSTADLVPDPLNHGWRDYGPRVGVWRLAHILERRHVPVTAIIDSDACKRYPEIVEYGAEHGWAWVAHGQNTSTWQSGMDKAAEYAYLAAVADRIERATGSRPRGWLGPALTASMNTNDLLAELGFDYVLDWTNDDQPYELNVASGRLLSVPYSSEVNDIPIFHLHHQSGPDFERVLLDQIEVLHDEGAEMVRVLGVGLHPFLAGQAFRAKYLARALDQIASLDGVWLTSSEEIAHWYWTQQP